MLSWEQIREILYLPQRNYFVICYVLSCLSVVLITSPTRHVKHDDCRETFSRRLIVPVLHNARHQFERYQSTEQFAWCKFATNMKMNADKTQLLWLGTRQQLNKLSVKELELLGARVSFSGSVSNLGVTTDSQLTMSDHVISLCQSCFFQLHQLRQVRSSLTIETTQTLVHAFISSRLHYCNSLLYSINDGLLKKLQAVQNAAARVTTKTRKFDHITPVLRELHWLPVRKRIVYKLAVMVYKCLHGLAPPHLAANCVPVTSVASRRHLRSAVLCPAASLSLGQEQHSTEGTLQSLEQQFGTIFRQICDSTRSHCCHLDKNWNSICLSHERTWGILFKSRDTNVRSIIIIIIIYLLSFLP